MQPVIFILFQLQQQREQEGVACSSCRHSNPFFSRRRRRVQLTMQPANSPEHPVLKTGTSAEKLVISLSLESLILTIIAFRRTSKFISRKSAVRFIGRFLCLLGTSDRPVLLSLLAGLYQNPIKFNIQSLENFMWDFVPENFPGDVNSQTTRSNTEPSEDSKEGFESIAFEAYKAVIALNKHAQWEQMAQRLTQDVMNRFTAKQRSEFHELVNGLPMKTTAPAAPTTTQTAPPATAAGTNQPMTPEESPSTHETAQKCSCVIM